MMRRRCDVDDITRTFGFLRKAKNRTEMLTVVGDIIDGVEKGLRLVAACV